MEEEEGVLHVPVTLQKLERGKADSQSSSDRPRSHYGTVYFPQGTTANEASQHIATRQQSKVGATGVWLLLMRGEEGKDSDPDEGYVRVKDSKHQLNDANKYRALYYNGPDIFLIKP